MGQPTPHQGTVPRRKTNTSPLTTPRAHRITTTLRKTIRIQLVCGMAHVQRQQAKNRQSTQEETVNHQKTLTNVGTKRFTLRNTHRKRCRNDTTHQFRRNNLIKCLHKKTLRSDFFTDTQTNKQTHHGGENFSPQTFTPTLTLTTRLPSPPCNTLILMKPWSKRPLRQTSDSGDKQ